MQLSDTGRDFETTPKQIIGVIKQLAYHLIYHADVQKVDLPRIDEKNKSMIKRAIEERLATKPEVYGKPLLRTLKGYWKLRVGDYRVVFKTSGKDIRIFGIIHRRRVYQDIEKRIEGGIE